MSQYAFLWIIDPKVIATLGVGSQYLGELRPAMCSLFRLHKVELLYDQCDVANMERSMRGPCEDFPNVEFVEDYIRPANDQGKLDCVVHVRRKLKDRQASVESAELSDDDEDCYGQRVEVMPMNRRTKVTGSVSFMVEKESVILRRLQTPLTPMSPPTPSGGELFGQRSLPIRRSVDINSPEELKRRRPLAFGGFGSPQ